jgi:hypothetical protein
MKIILNGVETIVTAEEFKKLTQEDTYTTKRYKEYPSISDQLDMIYWDKINGTNLWSDKITEIKQKYPKPNK